MPDGESGHEAHDGTRPCTRANDAAADLALASPRSRIERVIAHADELTALDQAIGDGDHGINMKRGLEAVLADLAATRGQAPRRGR